MRRLRLKLSYDGTDLAGWQIQPDAAGLRTVAGDLTRALSRVLDGPVHLMGAGRTDRGVHAREQFAHLDTENPLACESLLKGVNSNIADDIAVHAIDEVPREWDARRSATRRRYRYLVWNAPTRSPLHRRTSAHVRAALDLDAMARTLALFEGTHDFSAFRSSGCAAKSPVRTLDGARMRRRGPLLVLDFASRSFLHSQVRVMVGTALQVGRGKLAVEEVAEILEAGDRREAGPTAPACGLTLWAVEYPDLGAI